MADVLFSAIPIFCFLISYTTIRSFLTLYLKLRKMEYDLNKEKHDALVKLSSLAQYHNPDAKW